MYERFRTSSDGFPAPGSMRKLSMAAGSFFMRRIFQSFCHRLLDIPKQFQFLLLALPGDFHLLQHLLNLESGPNLLGLNFRFLCCRR